MTKRLHSQLVERLVTTTAGVATILVVSVLLGMGGVLLYQAQPAIHEYGIGFLFKSGWNAVAGRESYGLWPAIVGTLSTSVIGLLVAVPLGVGTAAFLNEPILPKWLRAIFVTLVELLAAVPSVVFGLWGIAVLIPLVKEWGTSIHEVFGWIPFFSTAPVGPSILTAGLVLAIMTLPIITSVAKDSLAAVPIEYRMGAYGLGASRWEVTRLVSMRAASSGILGGILLALGRALGETMAVTMVIGNSIKGSLSIFSPGVSIASLIANSFPEANSLQLSALMYAAGTLMILSLVVNVFAVRIVGKSR